MLLRKAGNTQTDKDLTKVLHDCLGFWPQNLELYKLALRHKSAATVAFESNERLEFLGDAVLGVVVGEAVYNRYPKRDEGYLTQMRSRIVSRESLNSIAKQSVLYNWIEVKTSDESERSGVSRDIGGNMLEALTGAVFLDVGFVRCRRMLYERLLANVDWMELECTETDYKSRIVERCQKRNRPLSFRVRALPMPKGESSAAFEAELLLDGNVYSTGRGHTKKDAEQDASRRAWLKEFNRYRDTTDGAL